jgi:peptidoglycan/xylan/chitin deacetylase (PgdA/CDA1 family)
MNKGIKALLSKVNFSLNRNPKLVKYKNVDPSSYIPKPYKAVIILSADFELAWAWRYAKAFQNPKEETIERAKIARNNMPKILELCDKYNIPITWATVGHLFLENCSKNGHVAHSQLMRLPYHENQYWRYDKGDWFDDDPCTSWHSSPEWYAPDLIKMILNSKIQHEIACHTFSHIDCRDEVCSPKTFMKEIKECQKCAQKYGIKLESFVHPGHTIGNLGILKKLGFTSFRTDYVNILGFPKKHVNGLWEFQSTAEFYYRKGWSINYHIKRYKKIIDRGIEHNRVVYLRFHPSTDEIFTTHIMEPIFSYISQLHKDQQMTVLKTAEYVDYLNQHCSTSEK